MWIGLLVVAAGRVAAVTYAGIERNRGDFYATLPGAYAQTLNPTLWSSTDLAEGDGFLRAEYLYGPTQYLTVFPLVFLDSYQAVATVLLVVYFALITLAAEMMWRSFRLCHGSSINGRPPVYVATWSFLPVLQAYSQREFEVVILFVTACALYALLTRRESVAGALLGYATWFKFFPLVFLPYFAARRLRRSAAAFVLSSVVVLVAAEVFLDLSRFNPFLALASGEMQTLSSGNFCEMWSHPDTRHHAIANNTRAGIKWALCSFDDRWDWFPSARGVHAAAVLGLVAIVVVGFVRLERRRTLGDIDERWRRTLEVSLLLMAPWMVYAHYYYLALAIIPLNALLVRYLGQRESGDSASPLWLWGAAYVVLGAFILPVSVLSWLLGTDYWQLYMRNNVYFFGQMVLLGLTLREYVRLSRPPACLPANTIGPRETRWHSRTQVLPPQTRTSTAAR